VLPVGWEHVDFAAFMETSKKSHSSAEITPSKPRAEAESDAHTGEESAENEQKSG